MYEYRFIFVVAFLGLAAALLTDRNRLPLALRGLRRTLGTSTPPAPAAPVPLWRRLLAFILILLAFLIAIL